MPVFLFTGRKGTFTVMLLIPNVSSQQFINVPPEPKREVVDKLEALLADETLPASYRRDNIRLLAQSPRKVYLYWDLAGDPFAALRAAFGPQLADSYRLMARLVNDETGDEIWSEAAQSKMQAFAAQPDQPYRAELGLYADGRAFIRLLSSELIRTPRAGVAARAAADADFGITPREFAQVLDEAGYVGDALEVTLEAADADSQAALSSALAQQVGGTELPDLTSREQAELRSLLAALALGYTPAELEGLLSRTLAHWLADTPDITSAQLLDALRATLGLALTGGRYDAEAAHRVARVTAGGSLVNLPAPPFHLWLPSMTAGARKG
jgi:hypothetical protein